MSANNPGIWKLPGATDLLKKLIAEGATYQKISEVLAERFKLPVSRNAVIGYSARNRLKLLCDPMPPTVAKVLKPGVVPPEPEKIEPPPAIPGVAFDDLPYNGCRWEISGFRVKARDMMFCGEPKVPGRPYCPYHVGKAYTAPNPRAVGRQRTWVVPKKKVM
jgi:hypothetical protein